MEIQKLIDFVSGNPYLMTALSWLGFGLTAGVTAKWILPGQENMGWLRTIFVGIGGAFLGGLGASYFGYPVSMGWNLGGFAAAVAGTIVCLIVNRFVTKG
jgi:uncharacterized membrane protein YeaQ/YmgE (transglycosylase-associated protein family)